MWRVSRCQRRLYVVYAQFIAAGYIIDLHQGEPSVPFLFRSPNRRVEHSGLGYIEVISAKGEGATFRFVIPASRARAQARQDAPKRSSKSASHLGWRPITRSSSIADVKRSRSNPRPHCLVVEDNVINSKYVWVCSHILRPKV